MRLLVHSFAFAISAMLLTVPAEAGRRTISGDYIEETIQPVCNNVFECVFVSDALPSDRNILLTQLSCIFRTSPNIRAIFLSATDSPQAFNNRSIQFLPPPPRVVNGESVYAFIQPLDFKVGKDRFIRISAQSGDVTSFFGPRCTFTGRLTPN